MNDKDYEALATEIYNTVNGYTGVRIEHIMPFTQLPQRLQEAYIQAAKNAQLKALQEARLSEEDVTNLAAVIYNDIQVPLSEQPVVPFALASPPVRLVYRTTARDAAIFVKNSLARHASEAKEAQE